MCNYHLHVQTLFAVCKCKLSSANFQLQTFDCSVRKNSKQGFAPELCACRFVDFSMQKVNATKMRFLSAKVNKKLCCLRFALFTHYFDAVDKNNKQRQAAVITTFIIQIELTLPLHIELTLPLTAPP